ncbi:hypothetical protein [Treponema socranskii]|uniref:hypothetical protein n=1 Tax=Treponema socranskii TaxID=53419 RepID=UPI003D8DAEAF
MEKKYFPKNTHGIISLMTGLFMICLVPYAVYDLIKQFSIFHFGACIVYTAFSLIFIFNFFGNRLFIKENTLYVKEWFRIIYVIKIDMIKEAEIGHFCKGWWSRGHTVLSMKIKTENTIIKFPIALYSGKQIREILHLLNQHPRRKRRGMLFS